MKKKMSKISKVLGIIGLCTGWAIPVIGITFGIIGLCVKKENYGRDIGLNAASLVIGIIAWVLWSLNL